MGEELKEIRQRLAKIRKQKEKASDEFRGFIKGVKTDRELSIVDKNFIDLFEFMITGFSNIWSDIIDAFESSITTVERINNLQTRVKGLEDAISQLRTTLDLLSELR